jgi:hypothetical protein
MNVRLVKRDDQRVEEKQEQPASEHQVKCAVQSWIKEFKARKAEPVRGFPPTVEIDNAASGGA